MNKYDHCNINKATNAMVALNFYTLLYMLLNQGQILLREFPIVHQMFAFWMQINPHENYSDQTCVLLNLSDLVDHITDFNIQKM